MSKGIKVTGPGGKTYPLDDAEIARNNRFHAALMLEVLSKGFGEVLSDFTYRCDPTDLTKILDRMNVELPPAIEEAAKAEKAYEPYWRRRGRRKFHVAKKKAKAT